MKRIALALCCAAAWAQPPDRWTPEISMRVQAVGDVVPSPDGRLAVYTQTRAILEPEKSENLTHIFLARAGRPPVQLTRGEKSAASPSFSPDGRCIYFLSERSGKPNLWRIAVEGGEAERLTDWKGSIGGYQVSPDGKWIAFTGAEPAADEDKAKKEKRDFRVVDAGHRNHAVWLVAAAGGRARRLTNTGDHAAGLEWSPDGRAIAFVRRPSPDADLARRSDIAEVDVESGVVRMVASAPAPETEPRYSPDGRFLAFARGISQARTEGERIVLLDRRGGAERTLPPTPDDQPSLVGWAAGGARLLFTEASRTQAAVYAIPVDGPPVVLYRPASGTLGRGAARLNPSGTHLGFSRESSAEPPEAFVLPVGGQAPERVSRANLDLRNPPLGETRRVAWKARDGLAIEGLLTYPVGYQSGKRYPLVLVIHGGPSGVFGETFIGSPGLYPYASFAARGYAVLRPNPRGSSGYGTKFRTANLDDWGGGDYADLMAGVDHAIALGIADPERLAVMGWSYGGYMTNWVVTQTQRFKAAASGAGLSNLWSMWGTNDIPTTLDDYFLGNPAEKLDAYLRASPLYHVAKASTPMLILHGEADVRVPPGQGYEMYQALKRRGVPVRMVVYPRTPHGPREPKFMLDIMQRHLDWVEKYVR